MKRALLYGKADKLVPWYDGFQIRADGTIDFQLTGVETFEIEEDNQEISWIDLFHSKLDELVSPEKRFKAKYRDDYYPLTIYESYVSLLWDKLVQYCNPNSKAEKDFFSLYCELCRRDEFTGAFLPALIPHVYINWYSSKEEREKHGQPYIVDFVFKSPIFGTDNLVIVEIDGPSHYANYDPTQKEYIISENIYAENLRKDRWLRKEGFKVFRIGNSEIRNIMFLPTEDRLKEFYYFFRGVFGEILFSEEFE